MYLFVRALCVVYTGLPAKLEIQSVLPNILSIGMQPCLKMLCSPGQTAMNKELLSYANA